ncbi:MAG: ankyrin repeat domain-containing protein [Gammaproteobacteria bacterium]|nr:ankyrin repeat domain-containing protein [Gammaproteobacteria bacterium]MYF37489.1 ankyrin repeat domain-containing protein [Gammaproteobacteria bacterium]
MNPSLFKFSFRALVFVMGLSSLSCSYVDVGYENVWDAIVAEDIEAIKKFLREDVDINAGRESDNRLPLMHAVLHDKARVAELLIENGADVNGSDVVGNSCLITAAFLGAADTVQVLIAGGADLFHRNVIGEDVMDAIAINWRMTNYYANEVYQLGVTRESVETGREKVRAILLNARERAAEEDIWVALAMDRLDLVKRHVEGVDDIETIVTPDGSPILVAASALGQVDTVKYLLEIGADTEARDSIGSTALLVAALFGYEEIAKVLLENAADVSTVNYQGTDLNGALQLDWDLTNRIATLIGLALEEEELKNARVKVKELIKVRRDAQNGVD